MNATPPHRILVVDDSVQVLAMVRSILGGEGYDVTTAESGEAALGLVTSEPFDLVLMDATMPGMSGFDACVEIKSLPQCADTPVVFLTGMNDRRSYQQALDAGGDDFLSKPISRSGLLVRVRALLRLATRVPTAGIPTKAAAHVATVKATADALRTDPRLPPALSAQVSTLLEAARALEDLVDGG